MQINWGWANYSKLSMNLGYSKKNWKLFFIVDLLFYSWLLFSIQLNSTIRIQFKNVIFIAFPENISIWSAFKEKMDEQTGQP